MDRGEKGSILSPFTGGRDHSSKRYLTAKVLSPLCPPLLNFSPGRTLLNAESYQGSAKCRPMQETFWAQLGAGLAECREVFKVQLNAGRPRAQINAGNL